MTLRRAHSWAAWSGWIFTAGFLIACLPILAWTIPPHLSPTSTPAQVYHFYTTHTTQIRAGAWIGMVASAFYYPWGCAIAALTRRIENGRPPVLTYTQLGAVGVAVFNSVLYFFWMAFCAYRPFGMDPHLLRTLNDFQFILLEFEVFPLSLWAVAIGLLIICDKSAQPVFPRWVAWVNFWFAGLVMTGQFMIFFHTGPVAWNGPLALYWPATVFFVWICVMSQMCIKGVKREYDEVPAADQQGYPFGPNGTGSNGAGSATGTGTAAGVPVGALNR